MVNLVGLILSFSANRNLGGYDISSQTFFNRLSEHFNQKVSAPKRSSVCEARQKLSWEAFAYLFARFNDQVEPELEKMKWKGHSIYAVDGSMLTLSHSAELKARFPGRDSTACKTHFPKARVVMATHAFTGIPKSFSIDDQFVGERTLFHNMLREFEGNSIFLLDRGFDGIASLNKILKNDQHFICRVRSELWSSREVYAFTKSKSRDTVVTLVNKHKEEIKVRLLKYQNDRNGNPIVLATSLVSNEQYLHSELWDLYRRRWDIETSFFRVKKLFKVESFHAKKVNGVLQEIWAALIVMAMTSYLVTKSWPEKVKRILKSKMAPNYKSAAIIVQQHFVELLFPTKARPHSVLFKTISKKISAIFFIRQFDRKNPRINKQALSTWVGGRKNKAKNRLGRSKTRRGIYA